MVDIDSDIDADFIIGVNGDSMEPTFIDREELFVKKQDTIQVGDIGIFMIDGQSFVKELGDHELISHNKKHQKISHNEDTRCIGKVIGKLK